MATEYAPRLLLNPKHSKWWFQAPALSLKSRSVGFTSAPELRVGTPDPKTAAVTLRGAPCWNRAVYCDTRGGQPFQIIAANTLSPAYVPLSRTCGPFFARNTKSTEKISFYLFQFLNPYIYPHSRLPLEKLAVAELATNSPNVTKTYSSLPSSTFSILSHTNPLNCFSSYLFKTHNATLTFFYKVKGKGKAFPKAGHADLQEDM